jgi:hypothetical protein
LVTDQRGRLARQSAAGPDRGEIIRNGPTKKARREARLGE